MPLFFFILLFFSHKYSRFYFKSIFCPNNRLVVVLLASRESVIDPLSGPCYPANRDDVARHETGSGYFGFPRD